MTARERRASPRRSTSLDVRYRLVGEAARDPARDISMGGVFVSCEDPLPLGSAVEVVLDDGPGDPLVVAAEVVRVVWGGRKGGEPVAAGMALRFDDVSDETRARLAAILAD